MIDQAAIRIPIESDFIAGTLYSPRPGRTDRRPPIVVCAHGLTGSRMGSCYRFVLLGRQLAERGIACLTFDFRGCGESAGRFIDVTCDQLQRDLLAVIGWLVDREGVDASRVGLCGSSFGAFTAARAARRVPGLKTLVFWAGVASPLRLFERAMTDDAWRLLDAQGWLDHRGSPLGKPFFDLDKDADDGPAALASAARPLLIFHAEGDTEVPIDQSEAYRDALHEVGVKVRLERLALDDHGMRDVKVNDRIIAESVAWFESMLLV